MFLCPDPHSALKSHKSLYCKEYISLNASKKKKNLFGIEISFIDIHYSLSPSPLHYDFICIIQFDSFRPEIAPFALGVWGY